MPLGPQFIRQGPGKITKKTPVLKITARIILLILLYFILPASLTAFWRMPPLKYLPLFFLVNLLSAAYFLRRHFSARYRLEYDAQKLQEALNILNSSNLKERKNNLALEAKKTRYNSLKSIIEKVNKSLSLDSTAEALVGIVFSLIGNKRGVSSLYLVDGATQKLALFKTEKENKDITIRAKEGDIFDLWVLKHATPLLIEDIRKDFRFDPEKLKGQDRRPVSSLISAPLAGENTFLGILRLDNPEANFFSQEDLRFLASVCDLGAMAIENSQFFQKTQELAVRDGLTSLYTKGYLLERLKEECRRSASSGAVFSLLMLDIDLFKNYNDKFGHTAGDIVLKNLSRRITEYLKGSSPLISRFGGEEFCILLEGADKEKAGRLARGLCREIEKEKIILRRQENSITVSIGVASFPADGAAEDELIQKADMAMYAAKQEGRNRVCST